MMNRIPQHTPGREYEPHEVENAAEHLVAAQQVKDNPELHAHALKHLTKTKDTIKSIQQIRNRAKALNTADMPKASDISQGDDSEQPFPDAVSGNEKASGAVKAAAGKATSVKR